MAERRALLEFPSWDGKLVLAGIFILGYYGLVLTMATRSLPTENIDIVRDAMLTLGPPIGVIVGALFRNTAAEERRDALRSNELQTAITTPSTITPTSELLADHVEHGAREGTRQGVEDAIDLSGGPSNPPAPSDRPPASDPAAGGSAGITDWDEWIANLPVMLLTLSPDQIGRFEPPADMPGEYLPHFLAAIEAVQRNLQAAGGTATPIVE